MESALSLKNGDYIDAAKANYETSKSCYWFALNAGNPSISSCERYRIEHLFLLIQEKKFQLS